MAYIDLRNITFAYEGEEEKVLKHFSASIGRGQCAAVTGDNGSGKTTLLRILNGLSFPQEGTYILDGIEITEAYLKDNLSAKSLHKTIGYLFQNPDVMLFNGNVYDEIAFGPRQMGMKEEEIRERTEDLLRLFDLEKLRDKAPYHLSGGQKKKVAFAAVLALNPEILALDEPLAGLDRRTGEWMLSFLSSLKEAGKTLIISTHDERILRNLAEIEIAL